MASRRQDLCGPSIAFSTCYGKYSWLRIQCPFLPSALLAGAWYCLWQWWAICKWNRVSLTQSKQACHLKPVGEDVSRTPAPGMLLLGVRTEAICPTLGLDTENWNCPSLSTHTHDVSVSLSSLVWLFLSRTVPLELHKRLIKPSWEVLTDNFQPKFFASVLSESLPCCFHWCHLSLTIFQFSINSDVTFPALRHCQPVEVMSPDPGEQSLCFVFSRAAVGNDLGASLWKFCLSTKLCLMLSISNYIQLKINFES